MPAPLSMPDQIGLFSLPNIEESISCCGITIYKRMLAATLTNLIASLQARGSIGLL